MQDEWFEWNDDKAASNIAKHGVSFEDASLVFDDLSQVDKLDDTMEYDEERSIVIGMASGRLLTVIYTLRLERTRIISARKANKNEQYEYKIENQF